MDEDTAAVAERVVKARKRPLSSGGLRWCEPGNANVVEADDDPPRFIEGHRDPGTFRLLRRADELDCETGRDGDRRRGRGGAWGSDRRRGEERDARDEEEPAGHGRSPLENENRRSIKKGGGSSLDPPPRVVTHVPGADQALRVSSWRPVAGGRSQRWTAWSAATAPAFFSASLSSHSMLIAPE